MIAITRLDQRIASEFPGLNVLINNAGIMRKINLHTLPADLHDITREVEINLNGPIRMVAQFAAPGTAKTGRHRQRLIRASSCAAGDSAGLLRNESCDPLLHPIAASATEKRESRRIRTGAADHQTALFKDGIGMGDAGVKPMDVEKLVQDTIAGIEKDRLENRPGLSNLLKIMSRLAPISSFNGSASPSTACSPKGLGGQPRR